MREDYTNKLIERLEIRARELGMRRDASLLREAARELKEQRKAVRVARGG